MKLSAEQIAAETWVIEGSGSLVLEAVAGSGKTTTLIHLVRLMKGQVAFTAYNKKIADEIGHRLTASGVGSNVKAGTFHSFGLASLRKVLPKITVDGFKNRNAWGAPAFKDTEQTLHKFVEQLSSLAKAHLIGVLSSVEDMKEWYNLVYHYELEETLSREGASDDMIPEMVEEGIAIAQKFLVHSIETAKKTGLIDFDDMLYLPLRLNAVMPQHDWVLVDEAQDTNPGRRALAKKMLRPGGRLIAVGDRHQAIYGFTGADADSLDLIAKEFNCDYLPLTVTYRCPKAVVRHAQQWVNHITAHESAPEGIVKEITEDEFYHYDVDKLNADTAILCRNTKPLVSEAYGLLRRGIPCHVEGRDIGAGLKTLTQRWKVTSVEAFEDKLSEYCDREVQKLMAKGQEQAAEAVTDKVDTLLVIIGAVRQKIAGPTMNDLRAAIDKLFMDTESGKPSPNLTLSTIHKSKGREWNTVILLGRNKYMPSKFARQDWQKQQETNLAYVAVTRAKCALIEVVVR